MAASLFRKDMLHKAIQKSSAACKPPDLILSFEINNHSAFRTKATSQGTYNLK